MDSGTRVGGAPLPDEEEWFGEGSAFDSGEDLAQALFALAGIGVQSAPAAEAVAPAVSLAGAHSDFEEVDRPGTAEVAGRPVAPAPSVPSVAPVTWSIRKPGKTLLPPRVPGRSGWTIRNSVAVLHATEEAMAHLREEAVESAFAAAADALARGKPVARRRRRPSPTGLA